MEIIATVKFIASKKMQTRNGLSALLKYCMQEKKTIFNDKKLVSGVNCVANSAFNEMMNTKIQYGKTAGRIFYHLIQSFHPDENITPEKAHQMAVRFASEQFKGYETVVSTHIDQEHIHSHFVINSVNFETGYKYHADKNELQRLRNESDKLCLEYGLSVIKPKDKKIKPMSAREYRSADKGQSWKLALAMAIDDAMCYAVSREHFIELMENEGYEVKWTDSRKNITYTTPNGMKCRDSRLHEEKYLKEMMENEFGIRQKIIGGTESTGKERSERFSRNANLRDDNGEELDSIALHTDGTDRTAENAFEHSRYSDNQTGTDRLYESADGLSDKELQSGRGNSEKISQHVGKTGGDDTDSDIGIGERMEITGWENERRIFKAALFGETNLEQALFKADTSFTYADTDIGNLGTGTLYLAAELTEIVDEEQPVEDCTSQPFHRERKNTQNGSMGGI